MECIGNSFVKAYGKLDAKFMIEVTSLIEIFENNIERNDTDDKTDIVIDYDVDMLLKFRFQLSKQLKMSAICNEIDKIQMKENSLTM